MQPDRFEDVFVSREFRFSLGVDHETSGYYLSTLVSGANRAVEWESFFRIDVRQFIAFRNEPAAADAFVEECRMGRNGDRLLFPES